MSTSAPNASPTLLSIVALETFFTPLPNITLPPPYTYKLTTYHRSTLHEVVERVYDADIVIMTTIPIRADALRPEASPRLKLIIAQASGTDSIDLAACAARGIRVLNSPNCNTNAVAQHAIALYFALRRSLLPTMQSLRMGQWPGRGTLMTDAYQAGGPPRSYRNETVVIVGHGGVGRAVEAILTGLGMRIVIAARRGAAAADTLGRVALEDALGMASVVILCCPRTPETQNLISRTELELMQPDCLLINVARGGVVDETALLEALRANKIAGAAVDVFDKEPASPDNSCLIADGSNDLNLIVTPHTAWIGAETTTNYQQLLQEYLAGFLLGSLPEDRFKI